MSQWWQQKPQLWQWQSDGENRRRDRWWDGWYQTDQGLWQQDRRGRQCDWKAQGHEWKQGEWEDSARGSGDAAAVAAKQQETGTASVAAGEACGDAAAVAANNKPDGDLHDPDDADAYALTEMKRECEDSATAAIAESFFAAAKAMDDGATSEDSVSSLSSWERFPQQTQAAGKSQHTKSAQTIREAAVAAKNQNEP